MALPLSKFGERFSRRTGALELMDDLGSVMSGAAGGAAGPEAEPGGSALMLGGGNPGKVPEVVQFFRRRLGELAASERGFERMLANYAHPRGELEFRRALARLLSREFGWRLSEDNVALTSGSQSGFFLLFNVLAGEHPDGSLRRVLLPVTPEYVGYGDLGLADGLFAARRPRIEELGGDYFKYYVAFDGLEIDPSIAAVCVSRPTNPTGNVVTDGELAELDRLCRARGVPLIIDGAYGLPFPGIVFESATPLWNDNVILCMSLSKLGLPAARTGIVVASEAVVEAITNVTAVTSLAVGSVGPVLAQSAVESGEIIELSRRHIAPFYRRKAEWTCALLARELRGLPFRIHKPEGAIFLWLWFPDLPIRSAELYARLKAAGVFVLSGHHFFPGLAEGWRHTDECIRLSFAQDEETVAAGVRLLARELRRVYG